MSDTGLLDDLDATTIATMRRVSKKFGLSVNDLAFALFTGMDIAMAGADKDAVEKMRDGILIRLAQIRVEKENFE